jgi:hypothetical protein
MKNVGKRRSARMHRKPISSRLEARSVLSEAKRLGLRANRFILYLVAADLQKTVEHRCPSPAGAEDVSEIRWYQYQCSGKFTLFYSIPLEYSSKANG